MHEIAALYVAERGSYQGLPGVDPWPESRDARKYAGPHPVVAHPPCQRWGKMWFGQPLTVKRTGIRKKKGDDGGCFKAALASVRRWGGVLEHPWGSHAWAHFKINKPSRSGGWISAGPCGGWTCCVEQGQYGHYARKPTLLLVYGIAREDLPELAWGHTEARLDPAVVERMGLARAKRLGEVGARGGGTDSAPRIGTPEPFRDLLISLARNAAPAERTENERLVERLTAKIAWFDHDSPERRLFVEARDALAALVCPPEAEDPEACTCQCFPTHCANDCPQHGLEGEQ